MDLATPGMHAVVSDCAAAGKVLVGLGRYMLHLPSLKGEGRGGGRSRRGRARRGKGKTYCVEVGRLLV